MKDQQIQIRVLLPEPMRSTRWVVRMWDRRKPGYLGINPSWSKTESNPHPHPQEDKITPRPLSLVILVLRLMEEQRCHQPNELEGYMLPHLGQGPSAAKGRRLL